MKQNKTQTAQWAKL